MEPIPLPVFIEVGEGNTRRFFQVPGVEDCWEPCRRLIGAGVWMDANFFKEYFQLKHFISGVDKLVCMFCFAF